MCHCFQLVIYHFRLQFHPHFYDQMLIDLTKMDYNKLLLGIIKVIFFREANSPRFEIGNAYDAKVKRDVERGALGQ